MFMFRKRQVRIHQNDPTPAVEGVLVGKPWRCAGHYVVRMASVQADVDRSIPSDSKEMWVPREKVVFIEVIN